MRYCVQRKSNSPDADPGPPPAGEIPNPNPRTAAGRPRTAVTAYNGKPYMRYCVQWKSPISVTAYNGKTLYPLPRTMEEPYMRNCVQRKSNSPDADPGPPPAGKIPNPNPRTTAGRKNPHSKPSNVVDCCCRRHKRKPALPANTKKIQHRKRIREEGEEKSDMK